MYVAVRKPRGRRGLGIVSTPVAGSMVYGSSPVQSNLRRSVNIWRATPPQNFPVSYPGWSGIPPWASGGGWSGNPYGNPYGAPGGSGGAANSQAIAQAMALLQTNPSLLSQQQFNMLQQAGLIAGTLPYSSVSQITPTTPVSSGVSAVNDPNCTAQGCTGGPYPNCTCAAAASSSSFDLSALYAGIPLWGWLAGGAAALYLFTGKRGR